jgi:photosystem II stability/assembly factor-like uncharacterized protein
VFYLKRLFNHFNPNSIMKKIYIFSILFFLSNVMLNAQNVPNGGFEDWEINGDGGLEPVGWETLNDDEFTDVSQVEGHTGQFAAKLSVEWVVDQYDGAMLFLEGNFSVSERFTALSFFLQGETVATDYLAVNIGMFKDGLYMGHAIGHFDQNYPSWTEMTMEIIYDNNEIPDSAFIGIQIYPLTQANYGTYYIIDDLNLNMGSGSSNPELLVAYTNVEGTAFELGFSESMADPAGTHDQFSGKRNGNTIGFTSASLKPGDDYVIVLNLADPVLAGDELKVSYTAGTVTSAAGEPLESFTDHAVLNQVGGTLANWQVIPSGVSEDLFSVHFANNTTGYIGGAMSRCLKSTNEGLNWSIVPVPSIADFRAVWATTSNDAYLGAWDSVYATHNGGQAWTPAYTNTFILGVMGLQFTSPNNGYAFMTYSSMTKTNDAGNSWSIPTGPGVIQDFYDGYMLDDNTGYGVGDCGLIAKTTDGGATWSQYDWNNWLEWSCIQIWGVHFTSALNGVATADSGVVFRTTDGGNHWNRSVIAGPEDMLNDVFFVNPATGYIVGKNGKMFKTTNGGETWIPEASLTSNDLHSVFFISENLGWAVGSNGTILRFGEASNLVTDPIQSVIIDINIYPNPFSSTALVEFNLPEKMEVNIEIFDISGRSIQSLFTGTLGKGIHHLELDLPEVESGVYICRISHSLGYANRQFVICK